MLVRRMLGKVRMMKVGIVGSGISGLAAARALAGRAAVTVFESAPRPGGHVMTVAAPSRHGPLPVDMGFIVCNRDNYPHFFSMLADLGVSTRASAMSFSVSLPQIGLEWGSSSLSSMFADRRSLLDRRHWRFLLEVMRFLRRGHRDLTNHRCDGLSLDEYLAATQVAAEVRDGFVVPLAAALWSLAPDRCGSFPAESYLRFLDQHGMLRVIRPLAWRTVVGGSQRYLDALLQRLRAAAVEVRLASPVARLHRDDFGVTVEVADGEHRGEHRFDRIVVATHADTALALLEAPSAAEASILGAFGYSRNRTVLHTDVGCLPKNPRAHASWNYVAEGDLSQVAVTYSMNRLQGLPADTPLLVTLNPRRTIDPGKVIREVEFTHPQFDAAALRAQRTLRSLDGKRRTYYAGAHFGFGFHEDGMRSGIEAAESLWRDQTRTSSARIRS
jgi:uncharacterized protein